MSPGAYAAGTAVPVERSRTEIERTLSRFGASSFVFGWDATGAMVGFVCRGRQIRMRLALPAEDDYARSPQGRHRTPEQRRNAHAQVVRERWRALALVIKGKVTAIESGIVTFEEEFAMHTLLPNGANVADEVLPAIESAYATGNVQPLLQIGPA